MTAAEHNPRGWPRAAASAAIFRGDSVLLVERGRGPSAGAWSLPGGHIEPGETAAAAALREVREETGLAVELVGLADVRDVVRRDSTGALLAHYLIAVYYGRWREGEPVAGSDSRTARFVPLDEIDRYPLTEGTARIIRNAVSRMD